MEEEVTSDEVEAELDTRTLTHVKMTETAVLTQGVGVREYE